MAPNAPLKRPAGAPEEVSSALLKKPAKWNEWAANGEIAEKASQNDESVAESGYDTTPITVQQRAVWAKALNALPGSPFELPEEVKKQWQAACEKGRSPKDRHAVVNAVLPLWR